MAKTKTPTMKFPVHSTPADRKYGLKEFANGPSLPSRSKTGGLLGSNSKNPPSKIVRKIDNEKNIEYGVPVPSRRA
jgi:hypothetical protein